LLIDSKDIAEPAQDNEPVIQKTPGNSSHRGTAEPSSRPAPSIEYSCNQDVTDKVQTNAQGTEAELGFQKILRGNIQVYVKIMATEQSLKTLTISFEFSSAVVQLSRLRNQYLAEFYGICLDRADLSFVFECPARGHLINVLEHSDVFHDIELRLTLMANIMEVIRFNFKM
jgi:hypothetical protein